MTLKPDNPVLSALRADFESKQAEGLKIISDPNASEAQLKRANDLAEELPKLQARIDTLMAVGGKLKSADDWSRQGGGNLPFRGEGGHGRGGAKPYEIEGDPGEIGMDPTSLKAGNLGLERKGDRWHLGYRRDPVDDPAEKRLLTGGFKSAGHFAYCLYKAGRDGRGEPAAVKALADWGEMQSKMLNAMAMEQKSPSGMFEMSDPDGGLLVPPEFSNVVYLRMMAQNQILSRLSPIPITSNQLKLRALKEDSRADGSRGGGILGYWENEANQYVTVKTQFRPVELNLHKLTVLTYVTEELMMDSNIAIDSFIGNLASKEINFKINDAVINGVGSGQPQGLLSSNSLITASAVSGQGANTFIYQNVLALYNRIIAGQRGSLVWLYNQDTEPQLFQLYQPTGTAAGVLIFTPNQAADGFNLMGRPALSMEQCQSLGTAGDVIAFATDGYISATKGGLQSFMSMHLRFDYDEFAFKWRFRFDGRPWDDKPLSAFKGSNTYSSMVCLSSTRT